MSNQIEKTDGFTISVKMDFFWIRVIFAIVSVILLYPLDLYFTSINLDFKDYVAAFTSLIVLITCYYHSLNLKTIQEINNTKLKFDKEKWEEEIKRFKLFQTKEILREWDKNSQKIKECRRVLDTIQNKPNIKEEFEKIYNSYESDKEAISWVLNYFEDVAIGIESGIFDEEYLKKSMILILHKNYTRLAEYIKFCQSKNSRLYVGLEQLINNWTNI